MFYKCCFSKEVNSLDSLKRNILLNPGPATTTDTVKWAQVVPDICPREREFAAKMKRLREELVDVVHGRKDKYTSVLFCGSGTICMDVCLNSLLPEGRTILIVDNGAYSSRGAEICEYYGLPHIRLRLPIDRPIDPEAVEAALRSHPDIGVVYTTHHETGTGVLNPVRELGALVHRYGGVFIVDTTSSYAMIPIDIERDNIDFCMASAQKGIMGMTGLSYVIGDRALIERSAAYPKRSYYCNLYLQYSFFETTGEMHFTPPVQVVYAAAQALREYFEEGESRTWERHRRVCAAIHKGLEALGFRETIRREYQSSLVVSVRYPDDPRWNFEKIHDYCYERGFTIYPGKIASAQTFRLCALGAIDQEDIERFFAVLRDALTENGLSLPLRYNPEKEAVSQ